MLFEVGDHGLAECLLGGGQRLEYGDLGQHGVPDSNVERRVGGSGRGSSEPGKQLRRGPSSGVPVLDTECL